jgi:acetyl-CoA carboxylase, biotin carboxylase subunit
VRVDDGFEEGMDIPIYYDPMISKLITHGKDRTEAIERMVRAIDDFQITGCQTTLGFCRWAIQHEAFRSGDFDTHFVGKYFKPELLIREDEMEAEVAALAAVSFFTQSLGSAQSAELSTTARAGSKWRERAK